MEKENYIIGIGAANIDLCGRSRAQLVMEDSNPGSFTMSAGGVTRNICENAARMGASIKLITVMGDDLYGAKITEHCRDCNIDLSSALVLSGQASSTYLSIHDVNGEMAVAMSDMSILQQLTPAHLLEREAVISGASVIVMDAGLPAEVLEFVRTHWGGSIPVFIDPVSTAYTKKLTRSLTGVHTVKPNRLEAEVLSGIAITDEDSLYRAGDAILALGAQRTIITLGSGGAYYADVAGFRKHYAAKPAQVVNATGAGDCFTGALLYGFLKGMEPDRLMDFAMTASVIALSHPNTIHPDIGRLLKLYIV
ncbi:MAG: carbohydrate kinase family protein [Angelakisella sp.]